MKKERSLWSFAGFCLTSLAGTVLHFLYDWTNESILIAPFSGVNESTWEHMKLLFIPLFMFALVQHRFLKNDPNFWRIKLWGTLAGLVTIPTVFYTYNGAFGKSPDWLNISIFFLSCGVTFLLESQLLNRKPLRRSQPWLGFGFLCLIGIFFIAFTFSPPHIPLFCDPLTGKYGIE